MGRQGSPSHPLEPQDPAQPLPGCPMGLGWQPSGAPRGAALRSPHKPPVPRKGYRTWDAEEDCTRFPMGLKMGRGRIRGDCGSWTREAVLAAEGAYVASVHRCVFVHMLSTKKTFILLNKRGDQGEVAGAVLFVQVLRFLSEKVGVVGCGCMCIQY